MKIYCILCKTSTLLSISLIVLFTLYLGSCKSDMNRETLASNYKYGLTLSDTLLIDIDSDLKASSLFSITDINSEEYICSLFSNYFHLYNLNNGESWIKINFLKYGPIGVGKIENGLIYNWDSVFLSTRNAKGGVLLTDTSNSYIRFINLTTKLKKRTKSSIYKCDYYDIEFQNSSLFLKLMHNVNPSIVKSWNYSNGLFYDTKDDNLIETDFFPKNYWIKNTCSSVNYKPSRIINKLGVEVYSFPHFDSVFLYKNGQLLDAKFIPFSNNNPSFSQYYSVESIKLNTIESHQLLYDWNNDIVFRLIKYANRSIDVVNSSAEKKALNGFFSIQIIDSSFNLIGEVDFPAKTYDYRNTFASKKGLLISLNNENNPVFEEDKLKLAVFQISKIIEKN